MSTTQTFIERKKPDIIFLFLRPFPLMPLQKVLVKYDKGDGNKGWVLHPALFKRQLEWKDSLTAHQTAEEFVYVRRRSFGSRDLNLIAGFSLGLDQWARKYILKQVETVDALCMAHGVILKIISPPQNPETIAGNISCKWLTRSAESFCSETAIGFIDIYSLSTDHFAADNIHFNGKGHQQLGKLIAYHLLKQR